MLNALRQGHAKGAAPFPRLAGEKEGGKKKNKNDRMPLTQPNPLSVQEAAPRAH